MGAEICKNPEPEKSEDLAGGSAALKQVVGLLRKIEILKCLTPDELSALAEVCATEVFEPTATVVKQGEPGDSLYCISKGVAKASTQLGAAASLMPGDHFGENSILRSAPRQATIVAWTQVSTLQISRTNLIELSLLEKIEYPERKVMAAGRDSLVNVQPPSPKTDEERDLMVKAIHRNENLSLLAPLSNKLANKLVDVAWTQTFSPGTIIFNEGDRVADHFYIVKAGRLAVDVNLTSERGKCVEKMLMCSPGFHAEFGAGFSFGERALLYHAPRAATVRTLTEATLWVMDRVNFKDIVNNASVDAAEEYVSYLEVAESFKTLDADQKLAVASNLMEMVLDEGEVLMEHGEVATTFYIMIEGKIGLFMDGKQQQIHAASPGKAVTFGQQSLMEYKPQEGTLQVVSESATFLHMDKLTFDMLLGGLQELLKDTSRSLDNDGDSRASSKYSTSPQRATLVSQRVTLLAKGASRTTAYLKSLEADLEAEEAPDEPVYFKDLNKLGVLGSGGFGLVELVEHKSTGRCFALKAVSKGLIVESGMIKSIKDEKRVQLMVEYPFVIRLYETYNQGQFLYFLLEVALGGELRVIYRKQKLTGIQEHAVFHSAGAILALAHLHKMKIIYRDLKSCNIMLSTKGYPKITDLGLAKVIAGKTYSTVGTPEYTAPEVLASQGYSFGVDWWALGVLVFELMVGYTPFDAENEYAMQLKIGKGIAKVQFPEAMSESFKDLIHKLCAHKPAQRIPMKKGGVANLKTHEWYANMDFDKLELHGVPPSFKPEVKSKTDLTNFLRQKPPQAPEVKKYSSKGDFVNGQWDKEFATQTQ